MGHVNTVKLLFTKAASRLDVDRLDLQGRAGLSWAAEKNHCTIVKELIAAGSNPDLADSDGHTPLSYAAGTGNIRMVELLLGYEVPDDTPYTYSESTISLPSYFPNSGLERGSDTRLIPASKVSFRSKKS